MSMYSQEHITYLKREKKRTRLIRLTQVLILFGFIFIWELAARMEWINTFITSSPSQIIQTIAQLYRDHNLFNNIWVTIYETFVSFGLSTIIGIGLATILWWNQFTAKVFDPYLTIFNSLPKVSLGPVIIIWIGATTNSIIFMAILITVIISIMNVYEAFINTDKNKIRLFQSFKATKRQIFTGVVLPSSLKAIINTLKINVSLSLVGVIMGELLVSKAGIGYLIMYGSQVFNLNLVVTGIFILAIVATIMYYAIVLFEKKLKLEKIS